jgi:flagellar biosynthesis GTPase FlhF
MTETFPLVLAAVRKAAEAERRSQWAIGDALIKEIGPPVNGAHDKRLSQCAKELAAEGYNYTVGYLRALRNVAFSFVSTLRRADVIWGVHRIAGTPERLEALIKTARGKRLTDVYARKLMNAARDEEKRRRMAAREKATAERERARRKREEAERNEREAVSEAEKKKHKTAQHEAAKQEAAAKEAEERNKVAPKRKDVEPPSADDVPLLIVQQQFSVDVSTIAKLTMKMKKGIEPHIPELGAIFINSAVDDLLAAANGLRELAELLRKMRINKRGHLHEVA